MEEIKNRVIKVIATSFNIDESQIKPDDTKKEIESWDSIGHLHLIMNIEAEFGIKLNTEDVVLIDSVEKCVEIVKQLMMLSR